MADVDELKLLIRSRHPLITIETIEERKAAEIIARAVGGMGMTLLTWTLSRGLVRTLPAPTSDIPKTEKPEDLLRWILQAEYAAVYVLYDFCTHTSNAETARLFRDVVQDSTRVQRTVIVVDQRIQLAEAIRRLGVPYEIALPDTQRLELIVRKVYQDLSQYESVKAELNREQMDALLQNLRGLTDDEAALAVTQMIVQDGRLNAADIQSAQEIKRGVIEQSDLLDFVAVDEASSRIGGLGRLRQWLQKRRGALSKEARDFGLEPPRGILLLGVQGCGKSLMAKVVASEWNLPLLRMDPSNLYDKFVGESERRLRDAIRLAEAMAPLVMWIDEIEKAFASAASQSADGGLSQRMFGTLLGWLQDHREPIFVVATANDISALPAELLRKGRFDEVFFVDLPDDAARREIFTVHLSRRKRDPKLFDLNNLTSASDGFSGAEIEQAIVSALYAAFAAKQELTTELILQELRSTQPLSVTMAEKVAALRQWAQGRCTPAN